MNSFIQYFHDYIQGRANDLLKDLDLHDLDDLLVQSFDSALHSHENIQGRADALKNHLD